MSIAGEPLSFRITSLIHFPPSWRLASGPHINPHAEQVEKDVFTWLDKHGLIPTEALKQRVGMMQVSGYAGMMQPLSSYSHCLAIAAFLTLWLLWDDVVVEKLGKEQTQDHTEQFIAIMVGKPAWNPENIPFRTPEMTEETHTIQITRHRYLCAWYDLMNNYIIDVDSSFRQRLGAVMKEWMIVGLEESELYYQWTHRDLKASYEATPSQQAEPQQPQAQPQTQPQTQSQTPEPAPKTAVTPTPTVDAPVASSAGTQSYVSKSLSALSTTKTRPTLTRQVSCISSKPIIIRQASLNRPNLMREPSHSKMVVQRLPSYKHKHVQPQASTTASTSTSALSIDARMINFPALEHQRRVSIGMIPTVQLLEWTLGLKQSLPTSILQNELFLEMIALSCKSVYILNELVSLGKDHAQGWPNLCEIWKNIQHTTIHDSIQDFVAQHVDVIERFDECECELLQQIDTQWQEAVKQHAQRIRYACYGFATWHVQCKRYMRKLRTEDGVTYWFAVDVSA